MFSFLELPGITSQPGYFVLFFWGGGFIIFLPVPVAARSKAEVCGRSPAEIVGSNPTGGMDVFLLRLLCVVK